MRDHTGDPVGADGSSDHRDLWQGILQQVTDYLIAQGYESSYLTYGAGIAVQRQTQLVQHAGELYRLVNAADIPLVLSGTWATDAPKLQALGDAGTFKGRLLAPNSVKESGLLKSQAFVARTLTGSAVGNLSVFLSAISSRTCNIVVVGDSIAEGKSEVNLDDAWPLVFVRALKEAFKDVTFNISNLSLAGRGTGNLYSAGYVGIAGPDNPPAGFYYPPGSQSTYHWPAGSAIGKSWREHIRDQAPDLVIAALGMNDVGGSSQDNANVTQSVLDYLASFSKVPSVALMTPMQPAEGFNPVPGMQEKIRQNAEIYRGLAAKNGCTLLDANRLSFLYRDAIDVVNTQGHRRTIDGYPSGKPSGWSQLAGPGFSLFGESLNGGGITQRNELMRDVYIDTTFTLADYATITPVLIYRKDATAPENAYQVVIAGGSKVIVHWQNACIASQALPPLPNGQPVRMEVRCRGGRHQVFVNNEKLIDTHNFEKLDDGYTALGIDGGCGLIGRYLTVSFREIKCGQPMFAGGDLYGYVNDFDTNPDSPGGSATNHPSALGHSVLYADACLPLLKAQAPTGAVLFVKAQDLTTDFIGAAPGSSARLSTGGTLGPVGAVPATSGVAALTLFDTQQVAGGQTITVNVQSSTSHGTVAMLSANLVLPSGIWVVSTRATLSRNASGFISFLDAVAMKA